MGNFGKQVFCEALVLFSVLVFQLAVTVVTILLPYSRQPTEDKEAYRVTVYNTKEVHNSYLYVT